MNNPPAFPRPASDAHQHGMHKPQDGMTLRDYFAAKAMQGLFASGHYEGKVNIVEVAKTAYTMADAMLKAREA